MIVTRTENGNSGIVPPWLRHDNYLPVEPIPYLPVEPHDTLRTNADRIADDIRGRVEPQYG